MDAKIVMHGLDSITRKLDNIKKAKYISQVIARESDVIVKDAGKYPPPVPRAGPTWYERGYGTRWATGGRRTSEQLGTRWYTKASGLKVIIGNTASYAIYVHGRLQARFHGRHGWKKVEDVAKRHLPKITKAIQKEIGKIWSR